MYRASTLQIPPGLPPEVLDLIRQIQREFEAVAESATQSELLKLRELYNAPDKPRTGMIVLADGTSWNPGSGAGFYGYYGSAWVKLG